MQLRYIALFALLHTGSMKADDGAASIAAGGLVFKRETGITMAKEVLNISLRKVSVDYEFRNNTDAEIVTEIAFPVPPYRYGNTEREPEEQGFDDFHLTVEGKPVAFQSEIRATVGSKDVTEILGRYHLDAATFSHAGVDGVLADLSNLSPAQRANLIRIGVLKPISMLSGTTSVYPAWTVVKKYYWTQVFPARGVVHIHHEYTPVIGSQLMPSEYITSTEQAINQQDVPYGMDPAAQRYLRKTVASFCLSAPAERLLAGKSGMYAFNWIDFILTTANTWRQPIEDFTLNVERTDIKDAVSFCWDGPVERADTSHFRAHAVDFVPSNELRIGFYQQIHY